MKVRENGFTRTMTVVVLTVTFVLSGCMSETSTGPREERHSQSLVGAIVEFTFVHCLGFLLDAAFNTPDYDYPQDHEFHGESARIESNRTTRKK